MLHPLAAEEILPLEGWTQWLEQWKATKTAEERHGLLHVGFDVRTKEGQYAERIIFFLSIAEGHDELYLHFRTEEEIRFINSGFPKTNSEARKRVSRKAFDELCMHFFKKEIPDSKAIFTAWKVQEISVVLEELLHFFRIKNGRIYNLPLTLEKDHNGEIAKEFLINLIKLGWNAPQYHEHIKPEEIERFEAARPTFVEMLCTLHRPDLLLTHDFCHGMFRAPDPIDGVSFAKLKEIVMSKEIHVPYEDGPRPPRSMAEAVACGSREAIVLQTLAIRASEFDRLRRIAELQEEQERARSELAKLET
ncbi:hypothetical protein KW796_01905 [Candidatus Parcubacteria bacterium]|nr:hypothetical protein [Candidatus Parcubacteria bacterium]